MIGGFNGTARAEGRFYMELRPQIKIEAPVGYHAAFDPNTFASILLLEDLAATKSATFCSNKTYDTRAMAEDMIDLLAVLHARFYGDSGFATQYRWVAPYPRWFTIGARKMVPNMQSTDTTLTMIERITTAMADLDALEAG
jgi:hypothetical protein